MLDEVIQVGLYVRGPEALTWAALAALPGVRSTDPPAPVDLCEAVAGVEITLRTPEGPVTLRRLPDGEVELHRQHHRRHHADAADLVEHLGHVHTIWHLSATKRGHLGLMRIVDALAGLLDGLYLSNAWYRPGGRYIETHRDRRTIEEVLASLSGGFDRG